MKKINLLPLFAIVMLLSLNGFSQNCKKFINYQTKVFDWGGVGMQLPGGLIEGKTGKINISSMQRGTSEKLEKLDLLQYNICEQLKNIKSTFLRDQEQVRYSNQLMKMMNLINNENNGIANETKEVMQQPERVAPQQDNTNVTPADTPPQTPAYTPAAPPCESITYKSDKDFIRGFGYGESKNRGMAKDYAISAALEAMALSMEVTVKVVGQHYRLSTRKEDTEDFEERLEKNTQTSINQTIRNINTVCEGETRNPQTNNWEYYIVYEVGREDAVKTVYNALQKDPVVKESIPNHEKFKQTFDEVMKDYEQSAEISFDFEE